MAIHTHIIVAPECAAHTNGADPCTCDEYYGFNGEDDLQRAVQIAVRQDGKRQKQHFGQGPDLDEADATTEGKRTASNAPDGHFWKRSEFLKCNAGIKMQDLDMSRFQGDNWQRAKEFYAQ